jgi:hypothetical protein
LEKVLQSDDVSSLWAVHAVLDAKFDLLAGRQIPKALVADGRVMHEYVVALLGLNVAKTLRSVKPTDSAPKA